MSSPLTKPFPRLWTLDAGVAMVVTDLHGDWDAYERYRDRFASLHASGQADYLIFTGDLIHADDPANDQSLEIITDVLALQATYGPAIIYLSGNHELPHIYSISLARGNKVYTPSFEKALSDSDWQAAIIELFRSLPFYLRTRAGVSFAHAGPPSFMVDQEKAQKIFNWSHQEILNWAEEVMAREDVAALRRGYSRLNQGVPYDSMAAYYLSVTGPDDPRYNHLLRGFIASSHPDFNPMLWPALFTRCEKEYGITDHKIFLDAMLHLLSIDYVPQQFLVTGHITLSGGHETVTQQHLRLASAYHATPREAGQYLLFDAGRPISSLSELVNNLHSVYK